jgi:uncharacterized protein DUF1592/uncharacterized protein DUF1588/uncharacterized protein DUF1587/uncharacterized protein DUF1595/uncharacterized protein DUF1585
MSRSLWRGLSFIGWICTASTVWAQSPATDTSFFATRLYPVLEAAHCRLCHATDGVASGTRIHFPDKKASQDQIQLFGLSLAAVVNRSNPSESLLFVKPTNRIKHTGGERIKPGSDEEKILSQWIHYLASSSDETLAAERRRLGESAGTAKQEHAVRRLTHSQYDNTVRDLLGDYSRPAVHFPPEDYVDGFKNQAQYQGMTPLLVEAYSTAAEKLALNAFRTGDINHLIPCKPVSATDVKCRDLFVRSFGLRAFRRPLREVEFKRYAAAFSAQASLSGKFLEGARTVVEAMLQSPNFLFHLEAGPDGQSVDYDIASRLSYLLQDTMPDKALLDSAAKGELRTAAGRDAATRRLLDDPRAHQALDEYFDQWLRFDRVLNSSKEERRFPQFSLEMAASMVEETRRLLDHLVWDDRNFMELLTADYAYLSSDLATLYKLPAPAGQFELVHFPAGTPRAGLLGEASFLAANAGPTETSPTARGIFIREQLLCQHVPPPPPNVDTNLPEATEDKPLTRRQRMSAHVENPLCASCHRLMDPIGFGLESFDAIGRFRERETILIESPTGNRKDEKKINLDLDTRGEVAGIPNSAFSDSSKLGAILAQSTVCQECMVRQIFRYAFGHLETASDEETIHQLFATFRDSGFHFKDLLTGLVRSPEFSAGLEDNQKGVTRSPGPSASPKTTSSKLQ